MERSRRVFEHPGRFAIVAVGLTIVACLGAIVLIGADTSDQREADPLPSEVVSLSPEPDTLAKPQQAVSAVLRPGLTGVLLIDGREIPEDQLERQTQNSMTFQPGPDKEFTRFGPGTHDVDVVYWPSVRSRDEAQTYPFSFRTTA